MPRYLMHGSFHSLKLKSAQSFEICLNFRSAALQEFSCVIKQSREAESDARPAGERPAALCESEPRQGGPNRAAAKEEGHEETVEAAARLGAQREDRALA